MTNNELQIESVLDHHYTITVQEGDDLIELMVYADPAVVALIATNQGDERRIVIETMRFLRRRQRADDLPSLLDLADVAAGYDSWIEEMRGNVRQSVTGGRDDDQQ